MTTIACKGGHMSCDSALSDNGIVTSLGNKITQLRSGALLGESGDADSRTMVELLQDVKTFADMPTAAELGEAKVDYTGLILFPDGSMATVYVEEKAGDHFKGQAYPVHRTFAAIGSGSEVALGAMAAGASAEQATVIACEWNNYCRAPVYDFTCDQPPGPQDIVWHTKPRRAGKSQPSKAAPPTTSRRRSPSSKRRRSR